MEANPYPWLTPDGLWKPISVMFPTATPAVSADIFVSDGYYRVRSVRESHSVASDSGTVQVEVLTSGQDADAGVDQLTGTMSLSGTADTPIAGTVIEPPTLIAPGNRVGLVFGGTVTNLVGCCITVHLERVRKGEI